MLTARQLCVLYPQYAKDPFNNLPKKRSPKRCLFGSPDPLETRRLLEEQFVTDREIMLRKYSFDILTFTPVTNICAVEKAESEDKPSNFLIQAPNEEADKRPCNEESDVRHRTGRPTPYNRQTRITDFFRTRRSINQSKLDRSSASISPA